MPIPPANDRDVRQQAPEPRERVPRRVVVITAEIEHLPQEGRALTNFLLELGLLALLVIAFGIAIYFIRRGAAAERAA